MSWEPAWRLRGEQPPWAQAFALLALAFSLVFILWMGRGTTFLEDEWAMIFGRRGWDLDTFFQPHNEHLVVVNVVAYKLLFALAGLDHYLPYRLMVAVAHVAAVVLVFVLARRRVGPWLAAALTAPVLVFGPGWEILLFPFGIFFLGSTLAGLGMMLAFDRGDRRGDVTASGLLGVALLGSSFGIPIALGAAAEILWRSDRLRRLWIVAVPVALYGIWYVAYDPGANRPVERDVTEAPRFVLRAAQGAVSAFMGLPLGVETMNRPEHDLLVLVGYALLAVALVALVRHLRRTRRITPRFAMVATTLGSFWVLTGIARGAEGQWYTGRYVYPAGILLVVLLAEVLQDVRIPRRAFAAVCVVAAGAALLNTGWLIKDGNGRRADAGVLAAELAAVEVGGKWLRPEVEVDRKRAAGARVGEYLRTVGELGSPALPLSELAAAPVDARRAADAVLVRGMRVVPLPRAPRPLFEQPVSGSAAAYGRARLGCYEVRPPRGQQVTAMLEPPPYGLAVSAADPASVVVRYRRFAPPPATQAVKLLPGPAGTLIGAPPDRSKVPWSVEVAGRGRFTLC